MKCLSIQIQPKDGDLHRVEELIDLSREVGRYPEIDRGEDDGIYINLNYFTEDLPKLWRDLEAKLMNDSQNGKWFAGASIIVCEGSAGWDDYLLLHHFDKNEELDEL